MKQAALALIRMFALPFVAVLAPLFLVVARTGVGASVCRWFGFQPVLIHYYQPVPRYEDVPPAWFETPHEPPGVRIDRQRIREQLERLAAFAGECVWPDRPPADGGYYATNPSFGYSSAAILHTMIRAHGTARVLEVGGGFSSLISLAALAKNRPDGGFRFTSIEPYPSERLRSACARSAGPAELLERKAEQVVLDVYTSLGENDVLFIDSSHVAKLASDVNFLYLEVLPRLRPGVIVHVHDIYLPYEYPRVHFTGRHKLYWNEQYVLAAFLSENGRWEVLLPGYHVQRDMADAFQAAFPGYSPQRHRPTTSFWMRKLR
ncbi:MAG TPA: class I SAM-dependent methyltransferase [Planctomycetaceae bacterium]|nr:class I SAM-dependent methyltransferase [Planctomycetaceae bacterium]